MVKLADEPEIKKDVLADGGDEVVAAGAGHMSPKRPHQPPLEPGPGTL